jgi:hypothetical protein
MSKIFIPLYETDTSESGITSREESKIFNGYVYNDGFAVGVTKRPGYSSKWDMANANEVVFSPFVDSVGDTWWIDSAKVLWKNGATGGTAVTTWSTLTTFSNNSGIGTVDWTDPSNAQTQDGSSATVSLVGSFLGSQVSHWLLGVDPTIAAPAGNPNITGIEVKLVASDFIVESSGTGETATVQLYNSGFTGNQKTQSIGTSSTIEFILGSPTDTWGLTVTGNTVVASTFGVGVSMTPFPTHTHTASVDTLQIRFYYAASTTGSNLYTKNGITWAEDDKFIYIHGGGDGTTTSSDYYVIRDLANQAGGIIEITDADHPLKQATKLKSPPGVVALDGYFFIIGNFTTSTVGVDSFTRIYNCDLGDLANWTSTSFISSRKPGQLKCLAKHHNHVVAFGDKGMEFFYNAGNPLGSPLSPRLDIDYDIGIVSEELDSLNDNSHSMVANIGDNLFFVGKNKQGAVAIYVLDNFRLAKISNPAVDRLLRDDGRSCIRGVLSYNNKEFLMLTPDHTQTEVLVYDLKDKLWYAWSVDYQRGISSNKLAIDNSAKVFEIGTKQDNGSNYLFKLVTRKINEVNYLRNVTLGNYKYCSAASIYSSLPGSTTNLSISYSDDDGQNFSTARNLDINTTRNKITRLGRFIDRQFKLEYTGDNDFSLYALILELTAEIT